MPDHPRQQEIDEQMKRVRKARMKLMSHAPFFSTLAMEMKINIVDDPSVHHTVIHADGRLDINLDYLKDLPSKFDEGILIHDVLHCALMLFQRLGTRNLDLATLAHDLVINNMVQESKYMLPNDYILEPYFSGWAWEVVYRLLLQAGAGSDSGQGEEGGSGSSSGQDFSSEDLRKGESALNQAKANFHPHTSKKVEGMTKEMLEAHWRQALAGARQAQQQSQNGWGSMPAGLRQAVDDIVEPKLDWRKILSRFVGDKVNREDYSYRRVNRRMSNSEMIFPALHGTSADVAIIIDTSGSMTGEPLREIMGEVAEIVESLRCASLYLSCDAKVQNEMDNPDQLEDILARLDGGGGSNFIPAFDYLEGRSFRGPALFFTDGWISTPPVCPTGIEVMWIMPTHSSEHPPATYGEVLYIPMDDNKAARGWE